jgi:hypothetical protein
MSKGLCGNCGSRPPLPGITTCEKCASSDKNATKKRRTKRKNEHLCVQCGIPLSGNTTVRCDACLIKSRSGLNTYRNNLNKNGLCRTGCGNELASNSTQYCIKCLKNAGERANKYKHGVKYDVMSHYSGNSEPHCAVCGISNIQYLTIDHVNGRKGTYRSKSNLYGFELYAWLKRNRYPSGHQVLCWNHNAAKRHNSPEGWDEPYTFTE